MTTAYGDRRDWRRSLIICFRCLFQRDLPNEQRRGLGERQRGRLQRHPGPDEGAARAVPRESRCDGRGAQGAATGCVRVSTSVHVAQVELLVPHAQQQDPAEQRSPSTRYVHENT